jgi:hypothetical protein
VVSRRLPWILLCAWTVCALAGSLSRSTSWAQDQVAGERGVLLLEGNRVMQGRITVSRDTYHLQQDSAGVLLIPKAQVRFQGPDLSSVYGFLLDGLPQTAAADDHVRLARWCISYKLMPEARFELQTALEMEPGRDDIRRNLSILDSHIKRPPPSAKTTKSLSPADRQARAMGLGSEEVEALGGLSREAGQQFTTRIQPILVHNCTNSACHGPLAEHSLKFTIVRGASASHSVSEKNLLTLMKYIDRDAPKSSPLWTILTTNHGAQGSSIFTGTKGPQQLQAFKVWVLSLNTGDPILEEEAKVARRSDGGTKSNNRRAVRNASDRSTSDEMASAPEAEDSSNPDEETRGRTSAKAKSKSQSDAKITERRPLEKVEKRRKPSAVQELPESTDSGLPEVEPIVSETRDSVPELPPEDAFDPEVFNRRQRLKNKSLE